MRSLIRLVFFLNRRDDVKERGWFSISSELNKDISFKKRPNRLTIRHWSEDKPICTIEHLNSTIRRKRVALIR